MPSQDSKPAIKEEIGDAMDEKTLGSVLSNGKKKHNNVGPQSRSTKASKVKKEEANGDDDDFEKPTSKKSSKKIDKVYNAHSLLSFFVLNFTYVGFYLPSVEFL